ncbi:MAG: FAD:protein FMN transferase [Clostridia bacterium]|nr:FAD:protein FMN transferase [Clostridia bacterium]
MIRKITTFLLLICIVLLLGGCGNNPINSTAFMFDTVSVISVYSDKDSSAADNTLKYCAEFENILSATNEQSELYKLNNSQTATVSEHILKNIQKANEYSELSDGKFDITIRPLSSLWNFRESIMPTSESVEAALKLVDYKKITISGNRVSLNGTQIDLGGIAKGYIADMAKIHLKEQGVEKAIINLGGNIVAFGREYDIGIKKPFTNEMAAVLKVQDKAVSTSGTYERCIIKGGKVYHHILDSNTGYPAQTDLNSATVICDNSVDADALSTVCILLGVEDATKLINGIDGVEAIFIDASGTIHTTNGIKNTKNNIYKIA